jgi:hypothetical protein
VSRSCRECGAELIDPNRKLSPTIAEHKELSFDVKEAYASVIESQYGDPAFKIKYVTNEGYVVNDCFYLKSQKHINIFYGLFVRKFVKMPSKYYKTLGDMSTLNELCHSGDIVMPSRIECRSTDYGLQVKKRI